MGVSIEIGQLYFEKQRHFVVVPYMRVQALGEERWRCVSLGQTLHGSLKEVTPWISTRYGLVVRDQK